MRARTSCQDCRGSISKLTRSPYQVKEEDRGVEEKDVGGELRRQVGEFMRRQVGELRGMLE